MESAYSMTSPDWRAFLQDSGAPVAVLSFWLAGLYRKEDLWKKNVSPVLIEKARERFDFSLPSVSEARESADGTIKFQLRFADGLEAETVLLPFHRRYTVCLSTQVGCGMNCSFCFTATMGLRRNLSAGEIVGQYLVARSELRKRNPRALTPSIVFMGQGEPLHNAEEVRKAIEVLNHPEMVDVGLRQMTLSTVGYLPGLRALKNFPRVNIALSLHSPFEDERNLLIPVNQKFPLTEVLQALDEIPLLPRQFITFEYLLIKGFNMSVRHADALSELLGHRRALVNLIPMNPFPGSRWERPCPEEIEKFRGELVGRRLRVMVRGTKGEEILAACGQLKVESSSRRRRDQ